MHTTLSPTLYDFPPIVSVLAEVSAFDFLVVPADDAPDGVFVLEPPELDEASDF